MGTKQFNNYEDLITYTRASKGYALRPVSYGTELVTNGDGSSTDGWTTANTTLSIVSEALRVTATGSSATASQGVSTVVGKVYKFSASLNGGTAVDQIRVGTAINTATGGGSLTSTGEFVFVATTSTTYITLKAGDVSGLYADFDNISVKEVLFDQPDGTLTLFEHPDDVPRVEWDSAGNALGLLVEEARTNKFVYSEAFNETNWQRPNDSYAASTLPFTEQSPTKVSNSAATLVDDSSGGTGGVYIRALVSGLTNSTPHTFSVFAKKDQLSYLALETKFFTVSTATVYFDLDAGTVGTATNCTGAIQAYPDGWYRCSLTFTTDASDTSGYGNIFVAEGDGDKIVDRDGTSSIFIFGAQFEEGSFPTSYMKNEGTTSGKDRSADVASIPVADFGYNQNEGTLFVEWKQSIGAASYVAMLSDGTATNRSMVRQFANGSAYYSTITNSVSQGDILTGTVVDNQSNKIGVVYKHNDAAGVLNGASAVTDATFLVPEGVSTLSIGSYTVGSSQYINGHIKSIKYYPRRLTNAQLQDLTS
jgi:hypothetical protein